LVTVSVSATAQLTPPSPQQGRNFDARIAETDALRLGPDALQAQAIDALRAQIPDLLVYFDPATGATRSLANPTGFLTHQERHGEPLDLAMEYVHQNLAALGLSAEDLGEPEVTDEVFSELSGVTHLYLRQLHQGIPVYNGQLHVNVTKDGQILSVNNAFLPGLASSVSAVGPELSASQAVAFAAQHLGIGLAGEPKALSAPEGARQTTRIANTGLSLSPITAQLSWLPVRRGEARLVWNFNLETLDRQHWYDFTVDAASGKVWTRFDWTADASYTVYAQPVESPQHTSPLPPSDARTVVTDPHLAAPNASPNGWHNNGTTSFTNPQGNNAHAYEDRDGNNAAPALGSQPNGGAGLNFNFPINLSADPSQSIPAAVTNLFYWNNIIHDVQYQYGFNEVSGNFQTNNFGRGGAGNDFVRAEAQDNALGGSNCNANFSTPPDGSLPRMQMFLCNMATPSRDGDYDAGVITHEYGHGISIRQVGGPNNSSCLNNSQQPGEGWSDWLGLVYTARAGDTGPQPRGVGSYLFGRPPDGTIRGQRYSTDPAINTWTYSSIAGMSIPHGVGSVWAQAIWEVYWKLVDEYGFSSNLYNATGGAGNQRALQYINEGFKNTACSPTFLQTRDGIIQAATTLNGGADVCRLWEAFAAFGLGVNATTGGSNSTSATNGFDVPSTCGGDPPPPPPPGCPTPTVLYTNNFETGSGLSNFIRGSFGGNGSVTSWRGIQTCTAQGGTRIFRYGGTSCTGNYSNNNFNFSQPNGAGGVAIPAGSNTATLSFGHRRRFESGFDGATLAVSLDGANYTIVPASAITAGGYNGTVTAGGCEPTGSTGLPTWTGVSTSFTTTTVNLDAVCNLITGGTGGCAGQSVRIAFTSVTDCSVTDDGWFLDNVQVTACTP
jgi:extracellular elastinolytic metalloproteinase